MQPVVVVGGGIIGLCCRLCAAPARRAGDGLRRRAGRARRLARQRRLDRAHPGRAGPVTGADRDVAAMDAPLRQPALHPAPARPGLPALDARLLAPLQRARFPAPAPRRSPPSALAPSPSTTRMREAGVRYEEHRDGLLFAYRTAEALGARLRRAGAGPPFRIRDLPDHDGDDLARRWSRRSRRRSVGGYWLPRERSVRPDTLVRGLVDYLPGTRRVEVRRDTPVSGIETTGEHGHGGLRRTGSASPPRRSSSPPGPGRRACCNRCGCNVPIEAGKGYSIDLAPPPALPEPVGRPLYLHETRVAITPLDGMIRLAGTMELSGLNHDVRPERVAAIARSAGWAHPRLAGADADLRPRRARLERPAPDDAGRPPGHRPAAGLPQPGRGQRARHARGDAGPGDRRGRRGADHHRPRAGTHNTVRPKPVFVIANHPCILSIASAMRQRMLGNDAGNRL